MSDALAIRQERPDQPDAIALIEALDAYANALYPPESNHLLDVAALCDPAVTFLVVRDGNAAVGCGAVLRDPRGWGEVKRMYVRPARRGLGLGRRLLDELSRWADARGATRLVLETGDRQPEALGLYTRVGFVCIACFDEYASAPNSLCYEKRLSTPPVSR